MKTEEFDVVILGSGEAAKYLAWTLAKKGMKAVLAAGEIIAVMQVAITAGLPPHATHFHPADHARRAHPAFFKRPRAMTEDTETSRKSQWCLVGNIVDEHPSGEKGWEVKHGTKHFSPGTKIYAFPAQWGDGYEKIIVVGRHRGSKDFVTMVIKSELVTNWRAKVVYNPEVLRRLQEGVCRFWKPQNWKGEAEVMKYLKGLQKYEADKRDS